MKLASLAKKSKYGEREKNNSISLKYGPDLRSFKLMKIASLHWLHFVRYRIHLFVPVNGSLGYKPHLQLIHGDYTDARI